MELKNRKTIAIDCHTLEVKNWAGKERFLSSILEEFKKEKEMSFVLYFRHPMFEQLEFFDNFLIVQKKLPSPFWQLFILFDLYSRKVDVLFSPCAYLLPALNFFSKNIIAVHDLTTILPRTKKFHKQIIKIKESLFLGGAIKRSEKIVAVSQATKNDCLKYFNVRPDKIEVVYLAAHDRFRVMTDKNKKNDILQKYGLKEKFILFVGTLEPRKNIGNLIRAHYKATIKHDNWPSLLIVGMKGWYFRDIFDLVKELKIENKIIFADYVADDDLPYLYNGASFFVYPSFYEGFGLPVLEAMACGCPVITSNVSSLPEVAGNSAVLIDPDDVDGLSRAMQELYNNKSKREKMAADGLLRAQQFAWQETARRILNTLKGLN